LRSQRANRGKAAFQIFISNLVLSTSRLVHRSSYVALGTQSSALGHESIALRGNNAARTFDYDQRYTNLRGVLRAPALIAGVKALNLKVRQKRTYKVTTDSTQAAGRRERVEPVVSLGFTLYCTQSRQGNFKVGLRTEKSRLQRSLAKLRDLMQRLHHLPVREQVTNLHRVLRGHFAYHGIAGNLRALQKVHRFVEGYWRKMLCSRSRKGKVPWHVFQRIKERFPLQRPRLVVPYGKLPSFAVL
jgi:hypothetical protein